tara:strand:+ start:11401 stop:12669 length:1269 start_codon:yes stop_codon:yes gene_type:complete
LNVKYFIVKGKKKYLSVYVRFWDSKRIDQKTRTGISVIYDDWSAAKQQIKVKASRDNNADFFNDKLRKLEDFVVIKYNFDNTSKKDITKTWLKDTVSDFFGRVDENEEYKAYLVPWVERFIKVAPNRLYRGKKIESRSVKNYKSALNKLIDFEAQTKKRYRFEDIDLVFHQEFVTYCKDVAKLNNNSIGNIINRIKTFCREIEMDGYSVNPQYKSSNFNAPKNETYDTYLNDDEINKIFKHDFSESERLDNVRDLFVIGLRTGLRISDFLRIKKENILGNVINITTQKTQQNLTIPIHPQFQKILNKRNGNFPKSLSDQKFNKYIKEVCSEAEIDNQIFGSKRNPETNRKEAKIYAKHELISSHCCRRSFASNLFAAGIDTSVIMKATGHKTESQFIKYIKLSQDEHIKKLSEYWDKQSKKE